MSTYVHGLPPTCLPSTCLSIPLYLPNAYLSTADLSTYVHWLPPTCLPSPYSFASAKCLPVYRRPANLCPLTTCLLPTCLPPICTPLIFYMPRADLSTCLPIPFYLPTAYLSTADLSTYVHWLPVYCRPVYRRSAHQCPLNTSLLPTCPPMSTYMEYDLAHINTRKRSWNYFHKYYF